MSTIQKARVPALAWSGTAAHRLDGRAQGLRNKMAVFDLIVEEHLRECLGQAADLEQTRKTIWASFVDAVAQKCWLEAVGFLDRNLLKSGFSQKEIANYLGIDRTVFNKILSGKVDLSFRTVTLVLTALNLNLANVDFPSREQRMIAGFLRAVPFVRWELLKDGRSRPANDPFTEEKLFHLEQVFDRDNQEPVTPDSEHPQMSAVPGFDEVCDGWGIAWLVCVWAFRPALSKAVLHAVHAIGEMTR
jgi:transcriptional regulator with XRE-family HTH domain